MPSHYNMTLKIGGESILPKHFTLSQSVNNHHYFTFDIVAEKLGNQDGKIDPSDVAALMGKDVVVSIENTHNSDELLEYNGIIRNIEIDKSNGHYDVVRIRGRSPSTCLDDSPHIISYSDMTLSDIVKKVFDEFDYRIDINIENDVTISYCVQCRETPFDFLSRLAFKYGCWFYFDGTRFVFGDYDEQKEFKLNLSKEMRSVGMELTMLPTNRGYTYYDYKTDETWNLSHQDSAKPILDKYGQATFDNAREFFTRDSNTLLPDLFVAENEFRNGANYRHYATGAQLCKIAGDSRNPGIGLGTLIETYDSGKNSLGKYLITDVNHTWDGAGNYNNHYKAVPASLNVPPPNPNVRLVDATPQSAIVVENADPENLGRIRVRFPWQDQNAMTPWIRVTYPYAGGGDNYFCPEIDDQVMIGFEMNNPDRPFVMGSVYHGKLPPQYASEDNTIKAIHTKCGHRIVFEDGDASTISIYTKDDKNQIVLDVAEDGQISITTEGVLNLTGKTINMEGDELNIKMDSAINLEAGQDVTMKGVNVSMSADKAASLSGMETSVFGDTSAEMTGTQVKVEGSAMAVLKGGMVNIN